MTEEKLKEALRVAIEIMYAEADESWDSGNTPLFMYKSGWKHGLEFVLERIESKEEE